jgi:hypothetical protein
MAYETIQPPFTLEFRTMSKPELRDYMKWFLDIIPERLDLLSEAVRQTSGSESWHPDFSAASLDALGSWFATQVELRPRTQAEIKEIAGRSAYPIEIPSQDLTNRTFSIAMDIAMYLSRVLMRREPRLRWEQQFKNKRDADYGRPVIVGFGSESLNPVRIVVTLAYGLADKTKSGARLRELHDIWLKVLAP